MSQQIERIRKIEAAALGHFDNFLKPYILKSSLLRDKEGMATGDMLKPSKNIFQKHHLTNWLLRDTFKPVGSATVGCPFLTQG